jgi:hypothetical protein
VLSRVFGVSVMRLSGALPIEGRTPPRRLETIITGLRAESICNGGYEL